MVRYALLGLLRQEADYGYRLQRRFEAAVGTVWRLNIGQVYQTLRTLERSGLIVEVPGRGDSAPVARRLYELTPDGRRTLERWIRRQPARPRPGRDEILVRLLVLDSADPEAPLRNLESQEQVYKRHLGRLLAQKRRLLNVEGTQAVVAVFGIEAALLHTEAHLKWLAYCREALGARGANAAKSREDR